MFKHYPSCQTCKYATKYIPYFTYPYSDPYCDKGYGKCEPDKLCGDYIVVTATCGRCEFIKFKDRHTGFICVKRNIEVSFAGKICDDYRVRAGRIND